MRGRGRSNDRTEPRVGSGTADCSSVNCCREGFGMTRRLFLGMACSGAVSLAQSKKIRVLLLTGLTDEQYHFWWETTPAIRKMLEATGKFEVRNIEEPRSLTPASLENCDVLLLNYNGPRFPSATEGAIEEFVRGGKGLFAFHQASYGAWFGMQWA